MRHRSHDEDMIRSALLDVAPFDVHATFQMQLLGRFDPTGARGVRSFRKVHLDARGSVVVWRFSERAGSLLIEVEGDDGGLLDAMTGQFPLADGAERFDPEHAVLRRLCRGYRGLRLMRMPWPFDVAAGTVLQQRVRWQTAYSDFRRIALRFGTRTSVGVAFPTSAQLAAVPVARLEALGLDPKRARALHLLASADARHGFLHPAADPLAVTRRMLSIRGIGPWTAGQVAGFAFGDPDAVPVGDLHLPSLVTSALAGEPEGTDERMLELLASYAGQRFRVIRLLMLAARRAPHLLHSPPALASLT
jgi:3-methyladenine DNA glycosylase/8-oxoguanine DNA glycosylase